MMDMNEKTVWFPAKRYGWGWSLPCAWQGWVVLAVWLGLLCGAALLLVPRHSALWIVSIAVLSAALFTVCLIKGEKPRWRWGNTDPSRTRSRRIAGRDTARSLPDRLAELDDLRRRELLSETKYEAMRQKIIKTFGGVGD